jgi:hypothetical protein
MVHAWVDGMGRSQGSIRAIEQFDSFARQSAEKMKPRFLPRKCRCFMPSPKDFALALIGTQ